MSYTSLINSTRTESHSIVPENKETNALNRIINAQGSGKTGSAIRKVANFIGMDAPEEPIITPAARGTLSVDFELERQQYRSLFKYTAAREEEERSRRLSDTAGETTRKSHAFVFSKSIVERLQAPRQWKNNDLPVSKKFLGHLRASLTAIEEIERQRRKEDIVGENAKRLLARQTVNIIAPSLIQPTLRSTGHLTNQHHGSGFYEALGAASGAAIKKLIPVAESFAASAYQIGTFAARAAYFFGGKAAVNAQNLGQQAVAQGTVLGGQALEKGQILGKKALDEAQILGHKAVDSAQYMGAQAQQAAINTAIGAQQAAINTAAGAQQLATQTIEKTKDLTHQAQVAASNAISSAQTIGEQAVEKVKDVKEDLIDSISSTLSWKQVAALEEAERLSRSSAQFGSNRFALAMQTSALVKAEIIARNPNYTPASEPNFHYGTAILEETERLRRIASDKASPVARINAKRSAAIISLYRQQTLGKLHMLTLALQQAKRDEGRVQRTNIAPVMVKEQPILATPVRYQAAM